MRCVSFPSSSELLVKSPSDGIFALPAAEDLPGRYLKQGEQIGFVIPEGAVVARVVVPQEKIADDQARTSIRVRN